MSAHVSVSPGQDCSSQEDTSHKFGPAPRMPPVETNTDDVKKQTINFTEHSSVFTWKWTDRSGKIMTETLTLIIKLNEDWGWNWLLHQKRTRPRMISVSLLHNLASDTIVCLICIHGLHLWTRKFAQTFVKSVWLLSKCSKSHLVLSLWSSSRIYLQMTSSLQPVYVLLRLKINSYKATN